MPTKKTPKKMRRAAAQRHMEYPAKQHGATPGGAARKQQNFNSKKSKPDIHVRKSTYSRVARLSVLASAIARQKLIELGGENTIDVIREFDKDMSDEELARKTGIKASDVRVVLNRLHNHGLFSYTRVRDRESGWYSYIWKMSEGKLRNFVGAGNAPLEMGADGVVDASDYLRNNAGDDAREYAQMARPRKPL